jgi:O-acetylhomoserine/O-acetylserine sulfhydrylase-like pyridoxal-dependent enzyme
VELDQVRKRKNARRVVAAVAVIWVFTGFSAPNLYAQLSSRSFPSISANPSVRSIGMGETGGADASDPTNSFLNPAVVRLERMCSNALAIAEFLAGRPEVRNVRYPGLPAHPAHDVTSRQMTRFGPVVSFDLADREAAERFLSACELVFQATSFGGVYTTAERRARWGSDKVSEGFIRMSAGCEHLDDLLADLSLGLAAVGAHRREPPHRQGDGGSAPP